jgi:hypothetical protein
MHKCSRSRRLPKSLPFLLSVIALWIITVNSSNAEEPALSMVSLYQQQVDRKLNVPEPEQHQYGEMLDHALAESGRASLPPQFFVLVDRNPSIQAVMIYWKSEEGAFQFIGASPTSTGKPGTFEHFETPLGVFDHTIENPDFRAEGTRNEFGILGYGGKGMRIYDFGWITAPKGWGDKKLSVMRFQMHATDPDILEPRLGTIQSKGCIRIPATLNALIDRYGLLDADYERVMASGKSLWVLPAKREPTPWSGRFMVVVDTMRKERPAWAVAPKLPEKKN